MPGRGRGRDNNPAGGRANPANGGRGNAGRGAKPPPRTGTVAAIGAFLDLGREMNHGSVSAWMRKFREYTRTNYTSNICEIFGNEGIPGEYPEPEAPANMTAAQLLDPMAVIRWKRAFEKFDKKVDGLLEDRLKVFGLMLGQISEASKATIRETESGLEAMTEEDPLLLLRAIILTHLSDPRLGADQNLLRVRMAYETVKMEPNDVLKYYYQRFKALKSGYEDTMRALGVMPEYNEAMTAHNDLLTAIKFMNGLNSGYKHYVEYYEHRLKEWPETLEDAYLEMAKVTPKRPVGTAPPNSTNVFAVKNAGGEKTAGTENGKGKQAGGAGRGKGGRTTYGNRPGICNTCKQPGHYSYECTAPESQAAASAASGGLKSVN